MLPRYYSFSDKERHVWQENCHVLWLTRLDNISEMTPLWRLCWFSMLPQPAKRNKLHTMKYFVGDPHSYHDHYVIQSGKTASVTSGLSQWSAAKRKQHWRWVILADTRQEEFTQNGNAHEINLLVGTFLVEQSSSRMTGSFSISLLKASHHGLWFWLKRNGATHDNTRSI